MYSSEGRHQAGMRLQLVSLSAYAQSVGPGCENSRLHWVSTVR